MMNTLREIHFNTSIINQHIVHLKIRLLTRFPSVKSNKSIVQGISGFPIFDDIATGQRSKSTENDLQVFISGHRIQFTHKQHVLWRGSICFRKVTYHFEHHRPTLSFFFSVGGINLFCGARFFIWNPIVFETTITSELRGWRGFRNVF